MTDYDCAAHVASAGHRATGAEIMAAKSAVEYDTHYSWHCYAKPTNDDRALIRAASERINS
jgi:hypothetical protein